MTYQSRGTIICVICNTATSIGRKLCRPCYNRARNNGTLHQFDQLGPNDVFESRIKKTKTCWLWLGTINDYGYGIFLLPGEIPVRAHRYAYEFFTGNKIPFGKIIMHTCDNPPCVNPAHLQVGTKAENNADTSIKHRHHYGIHHWNGRLTNADITNIRISNKTQKEIAIYFKISQSYVSRIKSGNYRK
jgi:hypothetical protein